MRTASKHRCWRQGRRFRRRSPTSSPRRWVISISHRSSHWASSCSLSPSSCSRPPSSCCLVSSSARRNEGTMTLYERRRIDNVIALTFSWVATAIGLLILFLILWTLLRKGVAALGPSLFTQMTPPPGSRGGIANAIYGSLVMTAVATLVGTPVGVLTGTYLAEF